MNYTCFDEFRNYCDYMSNGIGVRPVGSNCLWLCGEYIKSIFQKHGLNTITQDFTWKDAENKEYELFNVIGEIKSNIEKQVVLFCAHYDTVPTSKGGIDNTTGVAVMLELAATLCRNKELINDETTYRFVALAGEEVGCVGSKAYLDSIDDLEKKKIKCAYNFDMFMSKKEDDSCLVLNTQGGYVNGTYVNGSDDNPFDNTISRAVCKGLFEYSSEVGELKEIWSPRNYGHSDHQTFHESFIESANVTIRGSKRVNGKLPQGYHSKNDVYNEKMFKMDECKYYLEVVFRSIKYCI